MISSLGYLRIESADVGAWREFGLKVLGMTEGRGPEDGPKDGTVYLRMDDFPARLVIVPGSSERLIASGWEVADAAALAAVGRALADAGVAYKSGTADEAAARRVGSLLRVEDPAGHALEVFCGAALESRPSVSPYGNRFVTGDLGLGHVVLPVPPGSSAAFDFYTEVLGFRLRDSMRMPAEFFGGAPGDPPVWFRFLGCNPRHHSLALVPMPAAPGIVHLMIEVAALDDVGRALDRCTRRGTPVSGDARPACQRPHGLVLRAHPRRVRHRVRHRRHAGRRRDLDQPGDHRGQLVGAQLCRTSALSGAPTLPTGSGRCSGTSAPASP